MQAHLEVCGVGTRDEVGLGREVRRFVPPRPLTSAYVVLHDGLGARLRDPAG